MLKLIVALGLAVTFGVISAGAFLDGRVQALPLAIIFAALAAYSGTIGPRAFVRRRRSEPQ